MAGMTHRERVVTALNHEAQDAVDPYVHREVKDRIKELVRAGVMSGHPSTTSSPRSQLRTLLRCSKWLSSTGSTDGVGRPRPLNAVAI